MTLDGKEVHAGPGDIIPFPKYSTHALFNNCGETAKGIFWAEPTNKLFDLFKALHNVADPMRSFAFQTTTTSTFSFRVKNPDQKACRGWIARMRTELFFVGAGAAETEIIRRLEFQQTPRILYVRHTSPHCLNNSYGTRHKGRVARS